MDKNKKNITNMKENENKLSLHKLYEIDNINSNFFKNAIILKLLDSKELLYVIQEKKENSQSYLVELYDLINKKVLLTTKLQDIIADIILLDNNDIAYFVSGGAKIEDKLLTVLKGHKVLVFMDYEGTQFSHEMIAIGAILVVIDQKTGRIKKKKAPFIFFSWILSFNLLKYKS